MASSSSSPTPTLWDVFLSFRGTDTRSGFTSHLHSSLCRSGIRTFIDEPELHAGDVISSELLDAIKQSKTYIVVLSKNYASSSWCLDELVEILECRRSMQERLVLPIFYKIEPSVVRHQIESFKQAFEKHESRVAMDLVKKWRGTLKEVADFSGYHVREEEADLCIKLTGHAALGYELCQNRHLRTEVDIINEVVDRVLEVNPVTLEVAQHPVGINSRVVSLKSLLDSGSTINDVHWIGIHGMGGVGKTTLAKAFYNQMSGSFEGSCFLADIKNICAGSECHVSLQQQLIDGVRKHKNTTTINNIYEGISMIEKQICLLKVLVVLDDIDHQDQVKYLVGKFLATGSVIVLTTRNGDLLDSVKNKYKVNILDADESLQLFNQHAFEDNEIKPEFMEMSDEILSYAGGLPLALKVFGSSLKGAEKGGWEFFIDKLQKLPIETEVEKKLKISYDALESVHPQLQALFLDIACFFIGGLLDCDDNNGEVDVVAILETYYGKTVKEFISVLEKRNFITISTKYMLLRMHDLIRGMAEKIAANSRLVHRGDIRNVLENKKGTEAIEGMIDDEDAYDEESDYDAEDSDDEESDYDHEDSVICSCDAETFDRMPNLRFLKFYKVNMRGSFGKPFKELRWLKWYECPRLPSNFCADKLVILELRENRICGFEEKALVLGKLKFLDMSDSDQLSKTPDFDGLPCLETLNLSYCSSLVEVDVSIGNLERLATLDLSSCRSLTSLPDSICKLRALKCLNISYCSSLKALPMELGNIESLTELNAKGTHILHLPNSIGRLSRLVRLCLSLFMNLTTLPDIICKLRSLEILEIDSYEGPKELASGNSTQLSNQQLPSTLKQLKANCMSLLKLPDLSNLQQLVEMDLSGCSNLREVEGLEKFTSLEKLHLRGCTSMKRLPDLSYLQKLKSLTLQGCSIFTEIEGLEDVLSLTRIDLSDCISLKSLPHLSKLQKIKDLHLRNCSRLTEIQGFGKLISIEQLHLEGCTSMNRLADLSGLQNLKSLRLKSSSSLREMEGLDKLISIEKLYLEGCTSMKRLPDLSYMQKLNSLTLKGCSILTEIEGLEDVLSLTSIDLSGCISLKRLPNLSDLQQLNTLLLTNCSSLTEIEGLGSLTMIDLSGCISLKRLPKVSDLKQLNTLLLKGCSSLTGIESLEDVLSITVLDLSGCIFSNRLPNVSNLQKLKTLELMDCSSLTEFQGLGEAVGITTLNFGGCKAMERLPNLSKLQQLEILQLSDCISLTDIQGLEEVISLTKLDLGGCISLYSLPDLSKLQKLEYLWLTNCSRLTEIESVKRLISIRELHLGGCSLLNRLPNLSNLKNLDSLHVRGCSNLTEIQGLEEHSYITELDLRGCTMKRVPYVSTPPISIISLAAAGASASSSGLPDGAVPKEAKVKSKDWKLIKVTEPSLCLSTKHPDNMRVTRLIYTDSGNAILAFASNGIHLLSRWQGNDRNSFGMATASVSPQLWQPSGGFLMTNEVTDEDTDNEDSEDALSCFALSNDGRLLISESGKQISFFDMITFKMVKEIKYIAATFLAFHPQDNNIIAIGQVNSSIWIYDVHTCNCIIELEGHLKRITGLAFSHVLNVLVSSGADAQLCVWSSNGWQKQNTRYLQLPDGTIPNVDSDALVQFHLDEIHFLVVHETQLSIFEAQKLECLKQWVPLESAAPITHATFSCDSQLIYACFLDASLCVFTATDLSIQSRISPTAYLPPSVSTSSVHPLVIAAHPKEPNQIAVGLSDGGVCVFEPLEPEDMPPPFENDSASSVLRTTADGASCSDQAVRPSILVTYHRRVKQTRELKTYQRRGKKRKYGESIITASTD